MSTTYVNGPATGYAYEKIATTSAIGITASLIKVGTASGNDHSGHTPFWRSATDAFITIETAAIRWTVDGTTPVVTATSGGTGHLANAGDVITLEGEDAIKKFRCINAVASSGALVFVTLFRRD